MDKHRAHIPYRILAMFLAGSLLGGCGMFRAKRTVEFPAVIESASVAETTSFDLPSIGLVPGEKVAYVVKWLGVGVGTATLEITNGVLTSNGDKVIKVILRAKTNKFFSMIYNVEGTVESYVDGKTCLPIEYHSETHINKKYIVKRMYYDYTRGRVYAEDNKGNYMIDIAPNTLDPLGVFYYFRNNEVLLEQPISLTINGGKKNFPVTIAVTKFQQLHTSVGEFPAFQVEPTVESERQFDDALNAEGSMRIWFSADKYRIPLIVSLNVPVGTAQAVISELCMPDKDG